MLTVMTVPVPRKSPRRIEIVIRYNSPITNRESTIRPNNRTTKWQDFRKKKNSSCESFVVPKTQSQAMAHYAS